MTKDAVQAGFDNWKAKPHNARWWRHIDGTPIPNDLAVCIADAVNDAIQSARLSALEEAAKIADERANITQAKLDTMDPSDSAFAIGLVIVTTSNFIGDRIRALKG